GSLSARQVVSISAGTVRLPFISMSISAVVVSRRESFCIRATARRVARGCGGERGRELHQALEVVDRGEVGDGGRQRAAPCLPPAQSDTAALTRAVATSTSRCFKWRVILVSRVPNNSVCTRSRSLVMA